LTKKENEKFFEVYFFLQFLAIETLAPNLDPDSFEMLDPDSQHCLSGSLQMQTTRLARFQVCFWLNKNCKLLEISGIFIIFEMAHKGREVLILR
jgi:hypothetical protein